jgi:hypothetical protein|nr:hypothetical protein [Kofleriaceae bacterium]
MSARSLVVTALVLAPSLAYAQSQQTVVIPPQQPAAPAQPAPVVTQPANTTTVVPVTTGPVNDGPSDNGDLVYDPMNASVFGTGAVVFGGTYLASAIVAGSSDNVGDRRLWVPVVGPWLDLHDRGSCPIAESRCDNATSAKVLLVADGVFQAAGLLGMLDGVLEPSHHHRAVLVGQHDVHVVPSVTGDGGGLAAFGHF